MEAQLSLLIKWFLAFNCFLAYIVTASEPRGCIRAIYNTTYHFLTRLFKYCALALVERLLISKQRQDSFSGTENIHTRSNFVNEKSQTLYCTKRVLSLSSHWVIIDFDNNQEPNRIRRYPFDTIHLRLKHVRKLHTTVLFLITLILYKTACRVQICRFDTWFEQRVIIRSSWYFNKIGMHYQHQ